MREREFAEGVAEQGEAELAPLPEGFVIAVTTRRVRRLHFVGCCGKVPGEHYKVFEVWGDLLPPDHEVDVTCTVCFGGDKSSPRAKAQALGGEALVAETSSSSSSDSSSSSSSAEPEAGVGGKRRKRKA